MYRRLAHLILLDLPNNIWGGVQNMKLLTVQLSPYPVTSSRFGTNILLRTLFSNTLSLFSSLNVRDQVARPYKTTGRIMALLLPKLDCWLLLD
jgi:hypothetical protein